MYQFRTYQLAVELYKECEQVKCAYYVADQLKRASLSIALNLAEGSGKRIPKDKIKFYTQARGSLRETQCLVQLLNRPELVAKADKLGAYLHNLITKTQ